MRFSKQIVVFNEFHGKKVNTFKLTGKLFEIKWINIIYLTTIDTLIRRATIGSPKQYNGQEKPLHEVIRFK